MLGTIKNLVPVHQLVLKGGTALLQVVTRSGEEIQLETPKEVSGVHLAIYVQLTSSIGCTGPEFEEQETEQISLWKPKPVAK